MLLSEPLGCSVIIDTVRYKDGVFVDSQNKVATEIPLTITANNTEIATMLCTPFHIRELATGFLFTSGIINSASEFLDCYIDTARWAVECTVSYDPDTTLISKRLYTSGCGKGTMFSNVVELAMRVPVKSELSVSASSINELATWLQHCSSLYRDTGGIHSAALSSAGKLPESAMDDIGRHNAVDKVIGRGLIEGIDLGNMVLICSGRISSEILHKARRAGIAVIVARGAPTNQTVQKARTMGICVAGFARGGGFTVFSHKERITS